jgi:hypothetical protein
MHLAPDPKRRLARIKGRARASSELPIAGKPASLARKVPTEDAIANWIGPDGTAERRQCGRVPVNSEILVRRLGAFNFNLALKDISAGGCRVVMLEPTAIGDPVIARLPQLEPLGSRVCWAEGTTTGLQFLTTMHPAVFDMLLTRLANGETVEPPAVH